MKAEIETISPTGRYTVTQAAAILGVHRCTIDRWCKAGEIRARATNAKRRYFKGSDIIEAYSRH